MLDRRLVNESKYTFFGLTRRRCGIQRSSMRRYLGGDNGNGWNIGVIDVVERLGWG